MARGRCCSGSRPSSRRRTGGLSALSALGTLQADGGDRRGHHRDGHAVRRGSVGGRGGRAPPCAAPDRERLARARASRARPASPRRWTTPRSSRCSARCATRSGPTCSSSAAPGTNDTRHSEQLSTAAADAAGADAVLVVTPYYNKPNSRPASRPTSRRSRGRPGSPIILYNIPSRVVINISPEQLAELAQIENVVGVKQANDDELQPIDGLGCWPATTAPSCGRSRWGSRAASSSPRTSSGAR